jgi:hypothetical protein
MMRRENLAWRTSYLIETVFSLKTTKPTSSQTKKIKQLWESYEDSYHIVTLVPWTVLTDSISLNNTMRISKYHTQKWTEFVFPLDSIFVMVFGMPRTWPIKKNIPKHWSWKPKWWNSEMINDDDECRQKQKFKKWKTNFYSDGNREFANFRDLYLFLNYFHD